MFIMFFFKFYFYLILRIIFACIEIQTQLPFCVYFYALCFFYEHYLENFNVLILYFLFIFKLQQSNRVFSLCKLKKKKTKKFTSAI